VGMRGDVQVLDCTGRRGRRSGGVSKRGSIGWCSRGHRTAEIKKRREPGARGLAFFLREVCFEARVMRDSGGGGIGPAGGKVGRGCGGGGPGHARGEGG